MTHIAKSDSKYFCRKCKSGDVELVDEGKVLICLDCGFEEKKKKLF